MRGLGRAKRVRYGGSINDRQAEARKRGRGRLNTGRLKGILLRTLLLPGASLPFATLMKGRATVFMLHHFRWPEMGVEGHDPGILRQFLAYLRRKRFNLLPLDDLFRGFIEGQPLRRAVAFTIDDGYLDQAAVGAPVFAEFDCPVTTFVTTGFLDGHLWFWWDQIEYVFKHTARREIQVSLGDARLTYAWKDEAGCRRAQADFMAQCKEVPNAARLEGIRRLSTAAEVELPVRPPPCYSPMSWDQVRACEQRGMTFGPHTVTHPILSHTPDDQSQREICESWDRLHAEVQKPVAVFCYPNGRLQDFGAREVATLRKLGFLGGVIGRPGYADSSRFRGSPGGPFEVPRFGFPHTLPLVVQFVTGFERFKQLLRREVA